MDAGSKPSPNQPTSQRRQSLLPFLFHHQIWAIFAIFCAFCLYISPHPGNQLLVMDITHPHLLQHIRQVHNPCFISSEFFVPLHSSSSILPHMEKSSSSTKGLPSRPTSAWTSTRAPPLNTSPLATHQNVSSSSELSPHPSSISPSPVPSPWSQTSPLGATHSPGQFLPLNSASRTTSTDTLSSNVSIQQFNNTDWTSVFSAPLNPSVFTALTTSGGLGQLPPLSQGTPSSLPSSTFHQHHNGSASAIPISLQLSTPGSWSQVSPQYNHHPSAFPSNSPLPRSNTSLASQLPVPKNKFSPC